MSDEDTGRATLEARFQALSDGNRLRIVERLRGGERCVCELAEELELGQSLLSFHLKTLREANLVRARKEGRWMHYRLVPDALESLREFLGDLAEGTEASRCCEPGPDADPGLTEDTDRSILRAAAAGGG